MHRSILFAVLFVGLAACDSADPVAPSLDPTVFLGEWEVSLSETTSYATVSEAQDVPDLLQPATLGLDIRGDRSTTLTYVADYHYSDDGGALLRVRDITDPSNASVWASLEIIRDPSSWDRFELTTESGLNEYLNELQGGARDALSFDRLGVTIESVAVPSRDGGGGEVVIDGRLEFATRRVEAGDEIEQPRGLLPPPTFGAAVLGEADRVAFGEAGTVRFEMDASPQNVTWTGTWAVEGPRLRITAGETSALFDVSEETGVRLVSSSDGAVTEHTAEAFLVEPGTVESVRTESTVELAR